MFVNGRFGLQSWDLADPTDPVLLDHLTHRGTQAAERRRPDLLAERGHGRRPAPQAGVHGARPTGLQRHHLRPDRHRRGLRRRCQRPGGPGPADVRATAHRAHLDLRQRLRLPVDGRSGQPQRQAGRVARRAAGVRHRPAQPRRHHDSPIPIDTGRNDGATAYSHDVQVDAAGAVVAGGPVDRGNMGPVSTSRSSSQRASQPPVRPGLGRCCPRSSTPER